MSRRRIPGLLAAACLAAAAAGAASAVEKLVMEPAALARRSAPAGDAAMQVRDLARSGRVADAVAAARAALSDPGMDPAGRERLRYETLLALAGAAPDPSARAFVAESKGAAPQVFVRLDDPGHEAVVPAWDAPAAARYTERRWTERDARDRTRELLLARGDLAAHWLAASADERAGVLEALRAAPAKDLAGPAAALGNDLAAGHDVAEAALVVAARTQDPALFADALLAAPDREAVAALRDDLAAFGPAARVDILASALARDDLASAALLALGAEAGTDPAAEALLWSALSRPRDGASAAAALARLDAPGVGARLEALAERPPDPVTGRWARLALELAASSLEGPAP